jgi:hypothetical protein
MIYLLLIAMILILLLLWKLRSLQLDKQKLKKKLQLIQSEYEKIINDEDLWEKFGCKKELTTIMNREVL